MIRKTVTFALILSMIACMLTFTGSISYADVAFGYCGVGGSPNVMWEFDPLSGTLTISGNGRMQDYTLTETPDWDVYYNEIERVVVEDGVTGIGEFAFINCKADEFVLCDTLEKIGITSFRGTCAEYLDENNVLYVGQYLVNAAYDTYYIDGKPIFNNCRDYVVRDGTRIILDDAFVGMLQMYGPSEGLVDVINFDLVTLTLPSSVEKVNRYAFASCWSLQRILCRFGEGEVGDQVVKAANSINRCYPVVVFDYDPPAFSDVSEGAWYTEGVNYCYRLGFMVGVSDNDFAPDSVLTRAMFVTVMSKMTREDKSNYTGTGFTDVEEGKWYSKPIEWARRNGLVAGVGNGRFGVNDPLTREQFVTFLYAFHNKITLKDTLLMYYVTGDLSKYADTDDISGWAVDAMKFAVGYRFITGTSENKLSPKSPVTRAQAALMIRNYDLYILDYSEN